LVPEGALYHSSSSSILVDLQVFMSSHIGTFHLRLIHEVLYPSTECSQESSTLSSHYIQDVIERDASEELLAMSKFPHLHLRFLPFPQLLPTFEVSTFQLFLTII